MPFNREVLFDYRGDTYPNYLRDGNAMSFILPVAKFFCRGNGVDVGGGKWPLPGALVIDVSTGGNAMALPDKKFDFVFSSHCLEHIKNPVAAIEHWRSRLSPGRPLFLYLPHPDQIYWRPQFNRKHLHSWRPEVMAQMLRDLGFVDVVHSERDMYWSFCVVGFTKSENGEAFQQLVEKNLVDVTKDEMLGRLFSEFGMDIFRRSSALEPEFERIMQKNNFRGERCVEIGTFNGITAVVLSRFFKEVVSIDVLPHTMKHAIAKHLGLKNVRFVDVKNNDEKAEIIRGLEFDAAYVDGDHANDTYSDFDLVRRCGNVLFHEYWETQRPVLNLVNQLKSEGTVVVEGKFALWRR